MTKAPFYLLLLGILLFPSACFPFLESGSWRYRMTVEVETPEGLKTGAAVRQVQVTESPKLTPEMMASVAVKGEAVVIDLGKRGVLFALLQGESGSPDYAYNVLYRAFPSVPAHTPEGIRYYSNLDSVSTELPLNDLPKLVTFADMNDPTSVQLVDPENLAATFGSGVKLKRVIVEMTEDRVTRGVEKWLPPYGNQKGYMEWFRSLKYGDPRRVNVYDFKR